MDMLGWINQFLQKFIGQPKGSGMSWSLEQIIRAESTHCLWSCFLGVVVFSLTWIILSYSRQTWSDRYIFRIGLLWGVFASVTLHMLIDGFTTLA